MNAHGLVLSHDGTRFIGRLRPTIDPTHSTFSWSHHQRAAVSARPPGDEVHFVPEIFTVFRASQDTPALFNIWIAEKTVGPDDLPPLFFTPLGA